VLIDGSTLDTLPYNLPLGRAVNSVLNDVYGMDLFTPPGDALRLGRIPDGSNRLAWEGFSPERWAAIRRRWRVNDVLTPAYWELQLTLVVSGDTLRLYSTE
jgi:hypothetical protein